LQTNSHICSCLANTGRGYYHPQRFGYFHKYHQYLWSKFHPAPFAPSPFFVGIPDIFHPSLYIDVRDRLRIFYSQAFFPNVAAIISVVSRRNYSFPPIRHISNSFLSYGLFSYRQPTLMFVSLCISDTTVSTTN